MVCGALRRREQDDHAHYDQNDLHVLFHLTGSTSSDKSRLTYIDLDLKKKTQPIHGIKWNITIDNDPHHSVVQKVSDPFQEISCDAQHSQFGQ